MKKLVLIFSFILIGGGAMAQKSKIRSAAMYLGEKDYAKATEAINAALSNEDTKDNPDAWFTQAAIFLEMAADGKMDQQEATNKAYASLTKTLELNPKYSKEKITNSLVAVGYNFYNNGSKSFNSKNYDQAASFFDKASSIFSNSNIFGGNKSADTLAASALKYKATSLVYNKKGQEAIPILEKLKSNPIVKGEELYSVLLQAYESSNNESAMMKTIAEARKDFPNNKNFVNAELNYYIKTGRQDELIKKLEEAVAADPKNDELLFNLASSYDNMANPRDASGKELAKPANHAELVKKAAEMYDKALAIKPNEPGYIYNRGTLYFNDGVQLNKLMNAITGMSAAEQKKYEDLKVKRDDQFAKALPYFEKLYTALDGKWSQLNTDDKNTYSQTLVALSQIYGLQAKADKLKEIKSKLENLK